MEHGEIGWIEYFIKYAIFRIKTERFLWLKPYHKNGGMGVTVSVCICVCMRYYVFVVILCSKLSGTLLVERQKLKDNREGGKTSNLSCKLMLKCYYTKI